MAFTQTLIFVIIGFAASVLFLKDRVSAVLTYGAISIVAVVVFSLYAAPDVALAEASIGLIFTLFLYMVTLQHREKLWFGLVEVDKSLDALEKAIIEDYCKTHDLDLRLVKVKENEVLEMLSSGRIEVAGAAFLNTFEIPGVRMTDGFLETKVLTFGTPSSTQNSFKTMGEFKKRIMNFKKDSDGGFRIDLIRYISLPFLSREMPQPNSEEKGVFYAFGVVADEEERLRSLNDYLKEIRENGKLKSMVERYVR